MKRSPLTAAAAGVSGASRLAVQCCTSWPAPTKSRATRTQALVVLDDLVTRFPQGVAYRRSAVPSRRGFLQRARYARCRAGLCRGLSQRASRRHFYEQALYKRGWSLFKQARRRGEQRVVPAAARSSCSSPTESCAAEAQLSRAEQELTDDYVARVEPDVRGARRRADSLQAALAAHGAAPYEARCTARSATCTSRRNATRTGPRPIARSRGGSRCDPGGAAAARSARPKPMREAGFTSLVLESKRSSSNCTVRRARSGSARARRTSIRASVRRCRRTCSTSRSHHHALTQKNGHCGGSRRGGALVSRVPRRLRRHAAGAGDAAVARRPAVRRRSSLREAAAEYELPPIPTRPRRRKRVAPAMRRWSPTTRPRPGRARGRARRRLRNSADRVVVTVRRYVPGPRRNSRAC